MIFDATADAAALAIWFASLTEALRLAGTLSARLPHVDGPIRLCASVAIGAGTSLDVDVNGNVFEARAPLPPTLRAAAFRPPPHLLFSRQAHP